MKRTLKISALALVIAMLCLSITGCAALDERKDTHAVWTQKGSKDSITYNGEVYKLLENEDSNNPLYNSDWALLVNVTEPNVPALFSNRFGIDLHLSTDENYITGYLYDEYKVGFNPYDEVRAFEMYTDATSGKEVFYCKEDIYDEVNDRINAEINYTGYGYEYWDYSGSDNPYNYHYLSDNDIKIIDKILEETKPTTNCDIPYEYMCLCIMDEVSDDKSFGKSSYEVFYDEEYYYITLRNPTTHEYIKTYEIPEKYNSDFDRIFENALEN